jgi:hypothetical protein
MNFVGMGVPHILSARFPVVYNGKCYPPEFFPVMDASEFVEIPDETTRQWWQHWPFNYAKTYRMGRLERGGRPRDFKAWCSIDPTLVLLSVVITGPLKVEIKPSSVQVRRFVRR